jgi:hypothetical protein
MSFAVDLFLRTGIAVSVVLLTVALPTEGLDSGGDRTDLSRPLAIRLLQPALRKCIRAIPHAVNDTRASNLLWPCKVQPGLG